MRWEKLGLLHVPDQSRSWARTHTMLPTPLVLSDDMIRLFVSHADGGMVSRIGYIDLALSQPTRPIEVAGEPVLEPGEAGAFDDNGVNPCCAVSVGGECRLYYNGFQLQRKIPYTLFTGLALAQAGSTRFARLSTAPILERRADELFFRTAPMVLQDGGRWRMWYIGGSNWVDDGKGKLLPSYSLRHTESADGLHWHGPSSECLSPDATLDEIGFGRPYILKESNLYRLWYSRRRRTGYSLGYATSLDGLTWQRRDDEVGIGCAESGWDSEMICYAAIVPTKNRWLMFYNGNGYGRTGVGVAELVSM
jgi:predicted GH43/DUF377 family glycosyl hydrolase